MQHSQNEEIESIYTEISDSYHNEPGYLMFRNVSCLKQAVMCIKCYSVDKSFEISTHGSVSIFSKSLNKDEIEKIGNDSLICPPWEIISTCDTCKKQTKHACIDYNLRNVISLFNKLGYTTKFSCEGHKYSIGYIMFDNHEQHNKSILDFIDLNNDAFKYWMIKEFPTGYSLMLDESKITVDDWLYNKYIHDLEVWLEKKYKEVINGVNN